MYYILKPVLQVQYSLLPAEFTVSQVSGLLDCNSHKCVPLKDWKAASFSKGQNRKTEKLFSPSHTDNECIIPPSSFSFYSIFIFLLFNYYWTWHTWELQSQSPFHCFFVPQITRVTNKYLNLESWILTDCLCLTPSPRTGGKCVCGGPAKADHLPWWAICRGNVHVWLLR